MTANIAHVSSAASYTLRACECAVTATTLAAAKAEALALLAYVEAHTPRSPSAVALRFNGAHYVHVPGCGGWRKYTPPADTRCQRCYDAGITTRAGGAGCFACGRIGRPA